MFYHGKKVLVTGGTGFVGTHLVELLLKEGAQVYVTQHRTPLRISARNIHWVKADLRNDEDCRKAVRAMDFVFHAAGTSMGAGANAGNPMGFIVGNLVLTAQILQAASEAHVQRILIYSSSTGYPDASHAVKEVEFWSGPVAKTYEGYGWMRRYLEKLSEYAASKTGIKIALVRPAAIYGPWDHFDEATGHVIPSLIQRAVKGESPFVVWGRGDVVRDFLHVRDFARGSLLMLEKQATCEPFNIASGVGVTLHEIVLCILKATGREGVEVFYDASKPTTIPYRVADISKAQSVLGFKPSISLERGIAETVRWYQENKGMALPH